MVSNKFIVKCPKWDETYDITFSEFGGYYNCLYNKTVEGEWKIIDTKRIQVKRQIDLDWETYEFNSEKYGKAVAKDAFNGHPITLINKNFVPPISISML